MKTADIKAADVRCGVFCSDRVAVGADHGRGRTLEIVPEDFVVERRKCHIVESCPHRG